MLVERLLAAAMIARMNAPATNAFASGTATGPPTNATLSMASAWSKLRSLRSTQRSQSVAPFCQDKLAIVPPRSAVRPAVLPLTAPAVVVLTGDEKLKLPPGAVQVLTAANVLPKP